MTPPAASGDVRRARRTYAVVAVWIPVLLTTVAVTLLLTWLPQVPATVATHWGRGGEPDGFAPAWSVPLLTAAVGFGLAALFGVIALGTRRSGEWGPTLRFLGALSCGTIAFLLVLVTVSFAMQRGLTDANDSPSIGLPLIVGLISGAVAGATAWFAQPAVTVSGGSVDAPASAVALAEGERAAWLRTTTMSRPAMTAIAGVTLLMAVLAAVFGVSGGELWWLFAALALLFAVLAATTFVLRVSVTESGLRVRSLAGVPRFSVPLAEIRSVSVVRVDPAAEFGGWGFRLGLDGRFGIVLHAGEAIQVERRHGRPLVVTVDDAHTGAGLLAALITRAQTARP
ncbi:DUF1648 domain-containing protein [Microbacterium sp. CFH 31415]|uniref:DUF1648 domain-containing protein n=1 Tax=Microbacterium sp. CFH 31415 TaxID=2921732 RepID=UPI001F130263|nr:DUF1648 domain-containing protein [Microbacterium sp. CFH 31415]MCH6232255.1 DUF1648 domain-containing protein [Microbacterium sp. CFH 31415]